MRDVHRSEMLDQNLGKMVRLTMWNGRHWEGVLTRNAERGGRYRLQRTLGGDILFYKTHVIKVEVL